MHSLSACTLFLAPHSSTYIASDDNLECIFHFQAKAPRSTVVVVGTHLDEIPRVQRENKCKLWCDKLEKYRIGRHHSKAYPHIVGVHFVGCPQKGKPIQVEALNDALYDVAVDMDAPRGKHNVIR